MLRFNFAEVKESPLSKILRPDIILTLLVIFGALIAAFYMESSVKKELRKTEERIAKLEAERLRLIGIQKKEKELLKKRKELQKKLRVVSTLERGRQVPKPLYFFGNPENVKDIWLDILTVSPKKVAVVGNIWNVDEFPNFLKKVEEEVGRVLFRRTERVDYTNEETGFKATYYKFEFEAERRNGS